MHILDIFSKEGRAGLAHIGRTDVDGGGCGHQGRRGRHCDTVIILYTILTSVLLNI